MATIPEKTTDALRGGDTQRRYIAGHPYYIVLRYRERSELTRVNGPRWAVQIHDRETGERLDFHTFDFITDARRSFRTLIHHLANNGTPASARIPNVLAPTWASTRSSDKATAA